MAARDKRVLILAGTAEARELAAMLEQEPGIAPTSSFAGRTRAPATPAGAWRSGGFGGADGLTSYLKRERFDLVADASHPFAGTISNNAAQACRDAGIAYVRLERPAWQPQEGERWHEVGSIAEAADCLKDGDHALVTVGRQEIAPFFERGGTRILARMIEPPQIRVPEHATILLDRPPFTLESELELMRSHGITVLVTKNSGGGATAAKLAAARALKLPVVMVARPRKPEAPCAGDAAGLRDLILNLV